MVEPSIIAPSVGTGAVVGFVLGLIGGGGSILAVPLLVYGVGITNPHIAIGTSAVAVAASAAVNLVGHARAGRVKWPCAILFSIFGILGAALGSSLAKAVDGGKLLALFGLLMIGIGVLTLLKKENEGDPSVRLSWQSSRYLAPPLIVAGLVVGLLSGFFGIGGGFLIVPALVAATRMPMRYAVGTSLVAVTAFGLTTAGNYAMSGLVNWPVAAYFIAGGFMGGFAGIKAGTLLSRRKGALAYVFGMIVIVVGSYIVLRSYSALI